MQIPATQINAAGGAMVQLYDNIASGAIASWDVSGISQAYNHLRLVLQLRNDIAALVSNSKMQLNGDTGANYDTQYAQGNNASADIGVTNGGTSWDLLNSPGSTASANVFSGVEATIHNYAGANFKTMTAQVVVISTPGTSTSYRLYQVGSLWRSTAAINRLTVAPTSGNWVAGSRLTIYGLL